jgi:murein DD-endopeptidase MepM/ murein hydrolase activator NlpD
MGASIGRKCPPTWHFTRFILLPNGKGQPQWQRRINALFQDREFYIRSDGKSHYWKISAKTQIWAALILSFSILACAAITASAVMAHWGDQRQSEYLAQKQAETSAAEKRIAAYRNALAELAQDLDARQLQLEEWQAAYFGNSASPPADAATTTEQQLKAPTKISLQGDNKADLPPEARKLIALAERQEAFSAQLLAAVRLRGDTAENAVVKLGLNPATLLRSAQRGMGGPFIPYRAASGKVSSLGQSFAALNKELFRMEVLERTLVAVPSGNPANVMMLSSSYGYRSDPFTGASAMHSGLDFPGPIGSPIFAAAPGRISYVGTKSGYGKVIEVDHGQGIMTRYAHLAGFTAKIGDQVAAGQQIAKMGSTGRSTGSHLHFEVRLNGQAVNPRRFLEANADVREAKADARQRVGTAAGRII